MTDGGKLGGRYLTFMLGDNTYAIPVGKVEVVLEMQPITRVPKVRPHIRGVINHRGTVIPVIDLRVTFSTDSMANEAVSIIVLQVNFEGDMIVFGMLADGVREVLDLDEGDIEAVPAMAQQGSTDGADQRFVQAIAHVGDNFVVLVDMDAVFQDVAA